MRYSSVLSVALLIPFATFWGGFFAILPEVHSPLEILIEVEEVQKLYDFSAFRVFYDCLRDFEAIPHDAVIARLRTLAPEVKRFEDVLNFPEYPKELSVKITALADAYHELLVHAGAAKIAGDEVIDQILTALRKIEFMREDDAIKDEVRQVVSSSHRVLDKMDQRTHAAIQVVKRSNQLNNKITEQIHRGIGRLRNQQEQGLPYFTQGWFQTGFKERKHRQDIAMEFLKGFAGVLNSGFKGNMHAIDTLTTCYANKHRNKKHVIDMFSKYTASHGWF